MDSLDLRVILGAESLPPTTVVTPSGRSHSITRCLIRHDRHPDPVPRSAGCWAPNKPSIDFGGGPTFPEFVIVVLLERSGWEARWIKNWAGGIEPCVRPGESRPVPSSVADRIRPIQDAVPHFRGGGAWDILGWRGGEILFIESKQHRSSDRLRASQIAWMDAALERGFAASSFTIVEYDAPRLSRVAAGDARVDMDGKPEKSAAGTTESTRRPQRTPGDRAIE
jgi:hypothetical protein